MLAHNFIKSVIRYDRLSDSEVIQCASDKLRELRVQPLRRITFAESQRGKSLSQSGHLRNNVSFALYRTSRGGLLVVNMFSRGQVEKFYFESNNRKALSLEEAKEMQEQQARLQAQEMQAQQEKEQKKLDIQNQLTKLRYGSLAFGNFQCGIHASSFLPLTKESLLSFGDQFISNFFRYKSENPRPVPESYLKRRALYCLPTVSYFGNVPEFIKERKLPSELGYPVQVDYFSREKDSIIVPVESPFDMTVYSLQHINDKGQKKFLLGGRISGGCFKPLGYSVTQQTQTVILCEGVATANAVSILVKYLWSGYRKVGFPNLQSLLVLGCFDAHNIKAVAHSIRARYPNIKLIIAADNDHGENTTTNLTQAQFNDFLKTNTGLRVACELKVQMPNVALLVPPALNQGCTDWHDLLCIALNDKRNFHDFTGQLAQALIDLLKGSGADITPYTADGVNFWSSFQMRSVMDKFKEADLIL